MACIRITFLNLFPIFQQSTLVLIVGARDASYCYELIINLPIMPYTVWCVALVATGLTNYVLQSRIDFDFQDWGFKWMAFFDKGTLMHWLPGGF